jgi:hypothetical protein
MFSYLTSQKPSEKCKLGNPSVPLLKKGNQGWGDLFQCVQFLTVTMEVTYALQFQEKFFQLYYFVKICEVTVPVCSPLLSRQL